MQNLKILTVILLAIFTLIFISCEVKEVGKPLSQGTIEFEVTYPELDSNNIVLKFMPKNMEMSFKDNKYSHEWAAGLGLFKTGYVTDCTTKKMDYLLKLINVKYKSSYDAKSIITMNGEYPKFTLIPTSDTKEIAGYTCHRMIVDFEKKDLEDTEVFYTTHFALDDPNWCNPIKGVPGVMMEYSISKYDLTMKMTAVEVINKEIDLDDLAVPKEYQKIPNRRMEYKIKETFINFLN